MLGFLGIDEQDDAMGMTVWDWWKGVLKLVYYYFWPITDSLVYFRKCVGIV